MADEDEGVENTEGEQPEVVEKTLTESQVNKIVEKRLADQRKSFFKDFGGPDGLEELKAKAQKADEAEAAKLSEIEKANRRAELAEKRALEVENSKQTSEHEILRLTTALNKGLNAKQAKRLTGSTPEELEADADDLLEMFSAATASKPDPAPHRQPAEKLTGGGKADESTSVESLDREDRVNLVMGHGHTIRTQGRRGR
ncbi:hypothetical protein [Tsukamurella soli]|uniref:Scaffolding protein n=1 Tax=Tsukamurella soli TaxID=644556 RepID=A0ABP8JJR5_9ACTN